MFLCIDRIAIPLFESAPVFLQNDRLGGLLSLGAAPISIFVVRSAIMRFGDRLAVAELEVDLPRYGHSLTWVMKQIRWI